VRHSDGSRVLEMTYQLASICGVVPYSLERYIADEAACKERLAELDLKPFGAG